MPLTHGLHMAEFTEGGSVGRDQGGPRADASEDANLFLDFRLVHQDAKYPSQLTDVKSTTSSTPYRCSC